MKKKYLRRHQIDDGSEGKNSIGRDDTNKAAISRSFSPAFERLCSFVAVTHLQKGDEVLRQLLLHCFVSLPEERFFAVRQFQKLLDALFGLQFPEDRLQAAIDQLTREEKIFRHPGGHLVVQLEVRSEIKKHIDDAIALQERIKEKWYRVNLAAYPNLDHDQAWSALQNYLSRAFQRHGMQTIALLDGLGNASDDYSASLRSILSEVLKEHCEEKYRADAEASVKEFLATVGTDQDRTDYIVQLADGAFSYYSLTVPPDVAAQLRDRLSELTLFLDTNFLFGILNLHANPLVDVSHELIKVIKIHKLPFRLRYHEATEREMRRTIQSIGNSLKLRQWSQGISRAAAKSKNLSGLEQRFHERNAEKPITVDMFLKPYEHVDVLLKEEGIEIYRNGRDRLNERADLVHEYADFLNSRGKEKPYGALDHDVTLLDCVRQLRSNARSSLEAKALCITCDYLLSRFDWESSQSNKHLASTVLPNHFLQLLRPFIPGSADFDRSFAETFAIPEFRTVNSGASIACSKMLALLATYKGLREETVASMLANDILLDKLRQVNDDAEFQELVESEVILENSLLLEEMVQLKEQKEKLKNEKLVHEEITESLRTQTSVLSTERADLIKTVEIERQANFEAGKGLDLERSQRLEIGQRLDEEKAARELAERRAIQAEAAAKNTEKRADQYAALVGIAFTVALSILFEYLLKQFDWQWILKHQNSYAMRAVIYFAVLMFFFGLFRKSSRKKCWGWSLGLSLLTALLTLLGGPAKP